MKMKTILSKYRVFVAVFIIILILCIPVGVKVGSDDSVTRSQLETMSVLEWVSWRVETWQPRIVSDILVASFSLLPLPVWRVALALLVAVLMYMISGVTGPLADGRQEQRDVVICCLFMTMLPPILSSTLFWFTGSFYYPVPTLFMMVALVPVYRISVGLKTEYAWPMQAMACIAAALCSYMEQNASVFICFTLFTVIYCLFKKRKVPVFIYLELIIAIINALIYIKLGGTSIRETAELHYYKDYHMLTLVDRLFQGINWGNAQLLFGSVLPILALSALLSIKICSQYQSKVIRLFSVAPVVFIAFSTLPLNANLRLYYTMGQGSLFNCFSVENGITRLIDPMYANPGNTNLEFSAIIPSAICMFFVLLIACLIYLAYERDALPRVMLYFAALASSYAISISPTIFASGSRVFFLTEILVLVLVSDLYTDVYNDGNRLLLTHKRMIAIMLVAAAAFYCAEHWLFNVSGMYR